jgi:cellulose synthase operon protein C
MILCFPNADTFRLVVTSTLLPTDVTLSAAAVVFAADGRLFIDTPHKLTKKAAGELTKLGVSAVKALPGEPEQVSCWLQVIPTTKDKTPPQLSSQAPVLFELPSAEDLPAIVGEMIRLGNDRQGFRWLASADDPADKRVLLRVIGPPYYTLLRALDQLAAGKNGPIRAYTEQAPRVWVEVGHTHPFAAQIKLPDDAAVLIRGERHWTYLPEQPFQDVYEVLQFTLPHPPVEWTPAESTAKLSVPLKLVPGNAADAPELWVLRGDGVEQLDQFVKEADDRLTGRLKFAVADAPAGEKVVVLRVSNTRGTPPAVQLSKATGYKAHSSLPNLFVPVGTRLHPQLRRDAVRQLLADDLDAVVWLHPTGDGQFVPETVPDSAFHPLDDWVDYVIETAHAPLKEWVDATRFDFGGFVCTDDKQPKPKDPGTKGPKDRGKGDKDDPLSSPKDGGKRTGTKKGDEPAAQVEYAVQAEQKKPNEWKVKREELQKQFLGVDGPLDHPDRVALWPQLAVANTGAGDAAEAALCWANGLWEQDDTDPAVVRGWAATEFQPTAGVVTQQEFARRLTQADPHQGEVRQFAAAVVSLAHQEPPPAWLLADLPKVQKYIETNEPKLPVRVAWLAATRLARLSGADVLGLARIRDRLLQRLLEHGLNPEVDLPFFLRTAGLNDSDRVRLVRDEAAELHKLVRRWAEAGSKLGAVPTPVEGNPTAAYVDLLFAYALAKLGEAQASAKLAEAARAVADKLPADGDVGIATRYLYRAFKHRVDQAAAGQSLAGRLSPALLDDLDEMNKRGNGVVNSPHGKAHYFISRMVEQSRVLEPLEKPDPYKKFTVDHEGGRKKRLYALAAERDPVRLAARIRDEYRQEGPPAARGNRPQPMTEGQFYVLLETLPLSWRSGGAFAAELIRLVPDALRQSFPAVPELHKKQALLLERGLFLAGHFDHRDLIGPLVDAFVEVVAAKTDDTQHELINIVCGSCLRSLRKFGLRDEIDRLLRKLYTTVIGRGAVKDLKAKYGGRPDQWMKALQTLLNVAGGWLTFGLTDQATPILDDARTEILSPPSGKPLLLDFTRLVVAYIAAVGQGPAESGLQRMGELFKKIDGGKITNSFTTAPSYSRLHLNVVEEVVLAVASDDFALGTAGRRWLEDDEFLVRRRIHADMRAVLAGSGL